MASRGQLNWFKKKVWLYVSLWENYLTSHLNFYLGEQFPNEFMDSVSRLKSSLMQYEDQFVN